MTIYQAKDKFFIDAVKFKGQLLLRIGEYAEAQAVYQSDLQGMRSQLKASLSTLGFERLRIASNVRDAMARLTEVAYDQVLKTDFTSENSVTSRSERGTGLGLLLSSRIARAHTAARAGITRTGWIALLNDHGAVTRLAVP